MDDQIQKGPDPAKPVATQPQVPTTVGGGGDLTKKVKQFHEQASY